MLLLMLALMPEELLGSPFSFWPLRGNGKASDGPGESDIFACGTVEISYGNVKF